MTDIVDFPSKPPPSKPHPPRTLIVAAGDAVRLLLMTQKDLAQLPQRGKVRQAHAIVGFVAEQLEAALAAHTEAAQRELRDIVLTALGPRPTVIEVITAKRTLQMLADCLPEFRPDAGGAA